MELQLKNYIEKLVLNATSSLIQKENCCDCERCKMDIMAIALNNLNPRYIVATDTEIYAKLIALEQQFDVDVTKEITKAIQIVKENARH